MSSNTPIVSVVIPTRFRTDLLERAIRSALSQTLSAIEVIVVVDGQDKITEEKIASFSDSRLKNIVLSESKGASYARNVGVDSARGGWIAFLDDDDEWFAEKLESQITIIQENHLILPIVACRLYVQYGRLKYVSPRRVPYTKEAISDYLFVRNGLFRGEGSLTTSMILTSKSLLQRYPFDEKLKRHQEADWLLRVGASEPVQVYFSEDVLGIQHIDDSRSRISTAGDWRYSFDWAKDRRELFTPKSYTAFFFTVVSSIAARDKDWSSIPHILKESMALGYFSIFQFKLFLAMWIVPQKARTYIRMICVSIKQIHSQNKTAT